MRRVTDDEAASRMRTKMAERRFDRAGDFMFRQSGARRDLRPTARAETRIATTTATRSTYASDSEVELDFVDVGAGVADVVLDD